MKRCAKLAFMILAVTIVVLAMNVSVFAEDDFSLGEEYSAFDIDSQLEALGSDEVEAEVPEEAQQWLNELDLDEISVGSLLQLSPKDFFRTIWKMLMKEIKTPMYTLGVVVAVTVLCAMLGGIQSAVAENTLSQVFSTIAVLSIVASVLLPVFDVIVEISAAIKDAALFMLSFIPMFSAALIAAGQPVTGAAYNLFLLSACEVIAQIVAGTLVPLIGIYLALCVVGSLVPDIKISSATKTIKSIVTGVLVFVVTIFVGLLSIQSIVASGADTVSSRAAKFLIGSFVPVVGGALSEAYLAAQGCLRLIKNAVGAYGILVAMFTFLPLILKVAVWYAVVSLAAIAGDIMGVERISEIMKSCSSVLGILLSIVVCFALLIVVSTTVVMVTGLGGA